METNITNLDKSLDLKNAVLFDMSTSPGAVGLIVASYLVDTLKAKKIGEITSPFFPQISLVTEQGEASHPRIDIYFYQNPDTGDKMIFLLRNFPVEGNEGSYLIAKKIYDFCSENNFASYYYVGGARISGGDDVYISSNNIELVKDIVEVGAKLAPSLEMLPMDRLSGFLLSFFVKNKKKTTLFLAESSSYLPDPVASKKLLEILTKTLKINIDLSKLDEEIAKHRKLLEELERGVYTDVLQPGAEEKHPKEPSYIA